MKKEILVVAILAAIFIAAVIGGYLEFQQSNQPPITKGPETTPTPSTQQSRQTPSVKETPKPSTNQTPGQQAITVEEYLKHFGKYAWNPDGTVKKDVLIIGKLYIDDWGTPFLGPPYKDTVLLLITRGNITYVEEGIKVGDTVIVKGGWDGTEGIWTTEFSKYYVGFEVIEVRKAR